MKNDIESRLSVYASAFDEFVDTGKYPVHDEEDVLMAYLVTVFEDCLGTQWWSDEILRDLLKNSVLEFFSILLSCFQQIGTVAVLNGRINRVGDNSSVLAAKPEKSFRFGKSSVFNRCVVRGGVRDIEKVIRDGAEIRHKFAVIGARDKIIDVLIKHSRRIRRLILADVGQFVEN